MQTLDQAALVVAEIVDGARPDELDALRAIIVDLVADTRESLDQGGLDDETAARNRLAYERARALLKAMDIESKYE